MNLYLIITYTCYAIAVHIKWLLSIQETCCHSFYYLPTWEPSWRVWTFSKQGFLVPWSCGSSCSFPPSTGNLTTSFLSQQKVFTAISCSSSVLIHIWRGCRKYITTLSINFWSTQITHAVYALWWCFSGVVNSYLGHRVCIPDNCCFTASTGYVFN